MTNHPTVQRPNKAKPIPVLLLVVLMPIIAPVYLLGMLCAMIHVSAFCGYKNSERYFMDGLGFETNEQILKRLVEEQLK